MRDDGFEPLSDIAARIVGRLARPESNRLSPEAVVGVSSPRRVPSATARHSAIAGEAETGRQPKGAGDMGTRSLDRRSTAAGRDAAILQFVGKDRSIRAAASLGGKQKDKERAQMTATSGRAPATPADHVAVGS